MTSATETAGQWSAVMKDQVKHYHDTIVTKLQLICIKIKNRTCLHRQTKNYAMMTSYSHSRLVPNLSILS